MKVDKGEYTMSNSASTRELYESLGKKIRELDNKFLKEDFEEINLNKPGTREYEANQKRQKRIETYRKFANLVDFEKVTEDNINEYALEKAAVYCNVSKDRIRAEILGQKWSDYEL